MRRLHADGWRASRQALGGSRQLQQSRTIAESKELSAKVRGFFGMAPDTSANSIPLDSTYAFLPRTLAPRTPRRRALASDGSAGGCVVCGAGRRLQGLLIAPVQRIPRYILLLKELMRFTPQDTPDQAALDKALEALLKQADNINKSKKVHEGCIPMALGGEGRGMRVQRCGRRAGSRR